MRACFMLTIYLKKTTVNEYVGKAIYGKRKEEKAKKKSQSEKKKALRESRKKFFITIRSLLIRVCATESMCQFAQ